jgi:hypothetical protein
MKEEENSDLYARSVLFAVIDHLLSLGVRRDRTLEMVRECLESETQKPRSHYSVHAAVLRTWHCDPSLLDESASPKPLPLNGRWPSVSALIRKEAGSKKVSAVLESMIDLGLVTPVGTAEFLPVGDTATIARLHPVLIEHVANSLNRMLRTVRHNVSRSHEDRPLIERYTHVSNLSAKDIGAFKAFSQAQGSAFLANVEDWLSSKSATEKPTVSGVTAGIHLIAFVDTPRQRRPNPSPRRSRAKRA